MTFLDELKKRGYFYQCTNEESLNQKMQQKKIVAYIGFDCTAESLHIGNLMQVMVLRLLQQFGHKPIVLIGGCTTKIGDPTGKEEARKYLSTKKIESNIVGIKTSLSKFIKFGDEASDATILNNSEWLEKLGYIEFLRKMGKMFSVNRMLTIDSIKLRLKRKQPLTFLEFNYMLLQAFDFYYLNKEYNCDLQIGGSDQWGNIVTGVSFIRKAGGNESFGLTTPLLTTTSGVKMGKSINGAIWLNEEQLSVYDYYQYWRNTEDADVIRFAKIYCEFSEQKLMQFIELSKENINEAKKKLAYSITALCHGKEKVATALKTAVSVFEKGGVGAGLPTINVPKSRIDFGIPCYDLFFESGLTKSKSDSRRLVRSKGARINNQQIQNENLQVNANFVIDGTIKLSAGKKKHTLVKILKF